jgi:hypothetical protein
MTALDESTHRPSEQPVWRQGTLSDDEFERAALAISPSWELGLDVAPLSAPPPSAVTVGAFVAPSAAVSSVLVAASAEVAPAIAAPALTVTRPGVVPVEASMMSGSTKVSEAPARRPPSMRPPVAKRASDDAFEAPKRGNNKVWAIVGGGMLLAGALFVGFANRSTPTPAPTPIAEPATIVPPAPPPTAAEPATPPPPAVVAAPEPPPAPPPPAIVAAPEPPPAPPPPAVVAAPEPPPLAVVHRPAREREPVRPQPVARAPRVRQVEPARPAAAATPRAPSGAGFVTESPY